MTCNFKGLFIIQMALNKTKVVMNDIYDRHRITATINFENAAMALF